MPRLDYLDYVRRHTGLWVPKPLGFGSRRSAKCCCGLECDCTCSNCNNNDAPCCFQVDITGMVEGSCGSCSALNSTYYLSQDASNGCVWSCDNVVTTCDPSSIILTVYEDGSDYKVKVQLGSHLWEKNYGGSKPSCCTFSSEEISHQTSSGDCDSSSATCKVTARPEHACPCPCVNCSDTPTRWQITLDGIVNKAPVDCPDCNDLNETYIVEWPSSRHTHCYWFYYFELCEFDRLSLSITNGLLPPVLTVQLRDTGYENSGLFWRYSTPAVPWDCAALDEQDIPWLGAFGTVACDGSSSDCTVTAL